jgi:large subunit ribosomal protein L31
MKKDIHPQLNNQAKVTCVCGNSFTTISTLDEIKVDICSACHPFYTGTAKFVDTEGRIDKFNRKLQKIQEKKEKAIKSKKVNKTETVEQ